jgi:hypothetical protein
MLILINVQVLALFGIQIGIENQFRHSHNSIHWRADLMAHVGKELALGLAGGFRGFLGLLHGFFGALADGFGNIL